MYYRYEARWKFLDVNGQPGPWMGIFQIFNKHYKSMFRNLYEPKWYQTHPFKNSQCWFTQLGYNYWHKKLEYVINDIHTHHPEGQLVEFRLRQQENLTNVVMKGKTQCIIELPGKNPVIHNNDLKYKQLYLV